MDYRLTDEWSDPAARSEPCYTESLVRLPGCFLCYTPSSEAPLPGKCASGESGQVTFGSFNSYVKTTPEVLGLWASILHAVPGSRLLLKNFSLVDPEVRAACRAHFENLGIQPERLELHGAIASKREHLGLYRRMDIGLDTFPYNGTTTTCEALWMGIPVVTLAGERHAGRVGVSLLSTLGLPQLIARNESDYLELAVSLARDNLLRQRLRTSLREMMRDSPLCDGAGFCQGVESAYREIWTGWCRGRQ
jgi:predicted O-linked N-acetylglucosamine transferase (SPINDLY family)